MITANNNATGWIRQCERKITGLSISEKEVQLQQKHL